MFYKLACLLLLRTKFFLISMSLNMNAFCTRRMAMGVKERRTVCSRKIHFPLGEVGLNLQRPFDTCARCVRFAVPLP